MKNLKTGNYSEFRDISDGLHRPQYDKFRFSKVSIYKLRRRLGFIAVTKQKRGIAL